MCDVVLTLCACSCVLARAHALVTLLTVERGYEVSKDTSWRALPCRADALSARSSYDTIACCEVHRPHSCLGFGCILGLHLATFAVLTERKERAAQHSYAGNDGQLVPVQPSIRPTFKST